MQELVIVKNGKPTANSKSVADFFKKNHRDVLRDISNLNCSDDFRERNFAPSSYTSVQNKVLPCFEMTKDGFCFLAMGFTGFEAGKWKEAYIDAFNAMERALDGGKGMMEQINKVIAIMDNDKEAASQCGRILQKYKSVKKEHIKQIKHLNDMAQLKLGFKVGE
jgi:Rha family phage regulatory protein